MEEEEATVVIDNGSGMCRAGMAGEDVPRVEFSSVVGREKNQRHDAARAGGCYVGEEAQRRRGALTLSYPSDHGLVRDWGDMELVWRHAFDRLGALPEDHRLLLSEAPLNPTANRERTAQVVFETLGCPALHLAWQPLLAMMALGKSTATVLDSGDGVTKVLSIYDGHCMANSVRRLDVAGRDLTEHMMRLLVEKGFSFTTTSEREVVREIKEEVCYVASSPVANLTPEFWGSTSSPASPSSSYELPDGQVVTVDSERFRCPEMMFQPAVHSENLPSIQELTFDSIMACDVDTRKALAARIILAGGNTTFPGFRERLTSELEALAPSGMKVKVVSFPESEVAVWIGGSILASFLGTTWVSKQMYDERGPSVVRLFS